MTKSTKFGRYLKAKGISREDAAAALDLTRSYIQMLCTGAATPGLHAAAKIHKWTRGKVDFLSWIET
jgi:transcriptional regulator with XRE-family HTH domain